MPRVYIASTGNDEVEIATIVGYEEDEQGNQKLTLIVEDTEQVESE